MNKNAVEWARTVGLRGHPQVVLLVLATYRNAATGDCFPSIKAIAAAAGIAQSSVKVALERLETYGLIKTVKRVENNARQTSNYRLFIGARPNAKAEDDAPKKRFHLSKGEPDSGSGGQPVSGQGGQPEHYQPPQPESGQGGVSRSPAMEQEHLTERLEDRAEGTGSKGVVVGFVRLPLARGGRAHG